MKKTALAFCALLVFGASFARSADRRNFWLLNNTGRQITSVYIAAHNTDDSWGSNILNGTLTRANGTLVYFLDDSTRCVYDLKIGFADGSSQKYTQGRNVCDSHAIQLNSETNETF